MIHAPRAGRLSRLTLTVLIAGSAGLIAPAAVPAATATSPAGVPAAAVPGAPAAALPAAPAATGDLTSALEALAAADPDPDRAMMRQAFVDAGFSADAVEVSLDITPTGLAVDSIRGAAVQDGQCLFGEVRQGKVAVTVLPLLDAGTCFVGDQR